MQEAGRKMDGRRSAALKANLIKALDADEAAPEGGRPRLQRARASVAR